MDGSEYDEWQVFALLLVLFLLAGCAPSSAPARAAAAPSRRLSSNPLAAAPSVSDAAASMLTSTPTPTATSSPTPTALCPRATPEYLAVDAVTSPTEELTQWVTVHMGNMEVVTITAESGIFTSPDGYVELQLLPNTIHHLEVGARVRTIISHNGCVYGGYTLRTTTDRDGAPLIIVQGKPGAPRHPAAPIGVDNVIRLEELVTFSPDARLVTDFSFRRSDQVLSVGYPHTEPRIYGWSLVSGEKDLEIANPSASALVVVASPDGTLIATGGTAADPVVRLWEVDNGTMREVGSQDRHLRSLAFNPSGTQLASGGTDDTVQVWSVYDGQLVTTFKGDVPGLLQAFSSLYWPDDHTLIAGGSHVVYTWDMASGQVVRRVPAPEGVPFLVNTAFAAGGQRIAAVAQDHKLYLWYDRWAGWPAPDAESILGFVAFSPDEHLVAAETYDGVLYIWNAADGSLLATRQPASPSSGSALCFSSDGSYLVSGGWDAPIRVWGVPFSRIALPIVLGNGQ